MKRLIIAIDGPSAAGKSTAARGLAKKLSYLYLDTGAIYRAIAWKMISLKANLEAPSVIERLCQPLEVSLSLGEERTAVWIDQVDATPYLRSSEVTQSASLISSFSGVRKKLLSVQRDIGKQGGIVAEGRDIGTVVFPDADIKFYLDASISIRGKRRYTDNANVGGQEKYRREDRNDGLRKTTQDLERRDSRDCQRRDAPLKRATDSILIDSTSLDKEAVVEKMFQEVIRMSRVSPF
ncbi:MAG: (d)CMP kinase [Nitrospiria bacterium]